MTLVLPPFLPPILVTLAAGHFPDGDEDVMGGLAEAAWNSAKEQVNELADNQAAWAPRLTEFVIGESGMAAVEGMLAAEQNLRELAELFDSLAQQLKSGARDIEFEKLVVIFTLLILAVQLTLAVAFPGGALVALARWITAKKTIQSVYLQLLARLAVNGADFLGSQPLLSILVRGGGAGAIQGGGADLAAQYVQIGAETRDIVDRRQLAVSTASGFAGGVAGDVAARWVQPLTDRLGDLAGAAVGRRTRWTVELAVPAGVGGAAGAVAGAGAAVLMVGGDFGDIDFALTMFQGAGGGLIGAAGYALRPPATAVPGPFEAAVPGRFEQDSGPLRRLGSETVPAPSYGDSGNGTGPDVHVRATEPAPPQARPGHERSPAPPLSHGVSVALPAQPPPAADIGVSTESPRVAAPGTEEPPAHQFSEALPPAAATAVDPPSAAGPEDAMPQPARQIAVDAEPEALGTVEPVREDAGDRPVGAEVADTATTEFDTHSPQAPESIRVPAAETGVPLLDRATATSPETPTSGNSGTRPEASPDVHPARQPGERDLLTPETGDVAQPGFDGPPLPGGAVEVPTPPPRTAPVAARSNPGRTAEFAAGGTPAKESARTGTPPATRIEPTPTVFAPPETVRHHRPSESAVTAPDHADPPPAPDRGAVGLPASSDISPSGETATGTAARASDQYDVRTRDTTAPGGNEPGDQADDEAGRSFDELTTDAGVAPADQYAPLEDSAHLTAVQEALRGPDGRPLVHADPSVNRYGQLINDGGITKPGRSNNCVQLAMDALLSYYGRPAVGRARIEDGSDDGFLGERYGGERLEVWAGRSFRHPAGAETVEDRFAGVHAEVSGMRPGSAAVVGVQWRSPHPDMDPAGTDGHILTVVYPEGAAGPVWWDPQSGETWHSPPNHWIAHGDDLVYIPVTAEQGAALAAAASPDVFRYEPGPVATTGVPRLPETAPVVHRPEFFALAAGAPRPVPDSLPLPADYPPNATGFTRWLRDTAARLAMDEGRFGATTGPGTAGPPGTHRAKDGSADGGTRRPPVRDGGKKIFFPADPGPQNLYEITDSSVPGNPPGGDVRSEWIGNWNTAFDDRDRITARRGEIYRELAGAAGVFREKAAEYGIDTPVTGNSGRPYRSADDVIRLSVSKYATESERMRVALENDEGLTQAERDLLADEFTGLKRRLYEYHSLAVELIAASEKMGLAAGVLYALDPGERPDAVLLVPHPTAFDGPNVVDIASFVPASGDRPPKLVIVEAKGGKAGTLTPAGVYDRQKRDFVNAQQGSPEYLRRTLANDTNLRKLLSDPRNVLSESGIRPESPEGRELVRTVDELIRAHRNGTLEIEYHKVHARENGTVKAARFNLDPGDPKRLPVEIASIGGIIRETGGRSGDPEGRRATPLGRVDGNEGPDHAVVQQIRDQVDAEILRSAVEHFGRRDPDDVMHRLATRIETALDTPPARSDSFEKVAGIRDIDASKADLVRTMLSAWLGSWSPEPGYLHDIADAVAATVAAARGAVEIVVAAHGTGDDKGPRLITVIETAPGNADSGAETVWRLSPEPAVVERAAPAVGNPSRDQRDLGTAARNAQADRAEVDRQAGRVRALLRSAHPWMTADQIDSVDAMLTQTYTRALADSPDAAGRVTIESTAAGPHARGMRVTITSTLAEGRAALLPPWLEGADSGPHHLAEADAYGRTIELAAEVRTAIHWFEIHHGSSRQTSVGSPVADSGTPRYGSRPGAGNAGDSDTPTGGTSARSDGSRESGHPAEVNQIISPIREMAGLSPDGERVDLRYRSARSVEQVQAMRRQGFAGSSTEPKTAGLGFGPPPAANRTEPAADVGQLLEDAQTAFGGARLVVGGGHRFRSAEPGEVFLNLDAGARPDIVADCVDLSGLPDSVFTEVYFERVPSLMLPDAAPELYRVLRPGGQLSFVTGSEAMARATERATAVRSLRRAGFENIDYTVIRDNLFDPADSGDSTWNEISADKPRTPREPADSSAAEHTAIPVGVPLVWEDGGPVVRLGRVPEISPADVQEQGASGKRKPGSNGPADPPMRYDGRSTPWSEYGDGAEPRARDATGRGDDAVPDEDSGNTTTPWTNRPVDARLESNTFPGDSAAPEDYAVQQAIESRSEILGLRTPAERAHEAGLLIEECFLDIALVAQQTRPELLFGAAEWAGYLDARVAAKQYGDQDLTVDFMVDLHRRLSQFTAPDSGGLFTEPDRRRWGVLASPLSAREIEVVESNPRLTWLPPPLRPFGIIRYQKFPTVAAVRDELQALCDWYNNARRQSGGDPYRVAAELQREFVAIHPWDRDYNGRTSRLLMNWSLERDGLPASAVPDFDRDIVTSVDEWAVIVREGSEIAAERTARIERLGDTADPVVVFGLERERRRYREEGGELEPFTPGAQHDGAAYRALLARLRGDDMGYPTPP